MFSSQRREPVKKPAVVPASSPTASTSSRSSSTAPTKPPVKKITTVTRTVVVKRVVSAPPAPPPVSSPSSRTNGSPAALLKRKAGETPRSASVPTAKARKVEPVKTKKLVKRKQQSSSEEEASSSGTEEDAASSSDEGGAVRQRAATPFVERDVAATEDGDVDCISGEQLVLKNLGAYVPYFSDPADSNRSVLEWSGHELPVVTLEYPGDKASERLILLAPKNPHEEYDPIEDIITTIRMIVDHFLTPAQALAVFGHTPTTASSFSAFLSAPQSRSATPSTPGPAGEEVVPLMRALEKAKAKKDGPGFIKTIERFNSGLRGLKEEGKLKENIKAMKGVKEKIWTKICGQVYERAVGPEVEELRRYEAFSDNVYGELLPRFMNEMTGCESWGFENMAHASSLARLQVVEAERRFRMWGLSSGKMKVVEADFCVEEQVGQVLRRANVVLVNNEVFSSKLNERLSLLFLDLPSGSKIVSLKAFASSFTLSLHNQDSPLAILNQGPVRRYRPKSVSWKDEGGTYFIATVDRTMLEKFAKKQERKAQRAAEAAAAARG
ncbi:histone-lysine N-methyltransferase, H3 lysine-79 specific [Pseudohyphozyma bogoriensis]|nr:histone-lysine N-methyltransferase, H3 lysine-79 specific [Pseudohyphozyma bogoriensis]